MTQKWTQGGGEAGTSQSHSRHKKGHMMNIYFYCGLVKDHEELYDKTDKHFKEKGQEVMPAGEVRQQPHTVCQSVQDLVLNSKGFSTENSPSPSLARLPRK